MNIILAKNTFMEKIIQVVVTLTLSALLQGLSFYGNRVLFNGPLNQGQEALDLADKKRLQKLALQNKLTYKIYKDQEQKKDIVSRINKINETESDLQTNRLKNSQLWYQYAYTSNLIYALIMLITSYFLVYPVLRYSLYFSAFLTYSSSMVYGLNFLGNLGMFVTMLFSTSALIMAIIIISKKHQIGVNDVTTNKHD